MAQLRTILIVIVLAFVMIGLGRLIGGLTAPEGPISEQEVNRLLENLDEPVGKRIDARKSRAFAGLAVPIDDAAHWPSVLEQLRLARQYGVSSFLLQTKVPWYEEQWTALERIGEAIESVEGAEIWLAINLNPGPIWFEEFSDERSSFLTDGAVFPSVGSAEWRNSGSTALLRAGRELQEAFADVRIAGVILEGLEDGRWHRRVNYDTSPANTLAFREWLVRKYEDVETLSSAWDMPVNSFEALTPPDAPTQQGLVFFEDPLYVDYMDYLNATTANAVLFFADCAREAFGRNTSIFVPYGGVFDHSWPEHGQWRLSTVLDGEVDGLVFGVHREDRSVGDVGGVSGPSTVPELRGKRWMLLDDTRTGIGWNASTNGIFKPAGFDMRTLAPIYDRNLLSAAMERAGVFVWDSRGVGNYLDSSIWDYFVSRVPVIDALQNEAGAASRTVLVVLDEPSMNHVADGERIGKLLNGVRSAVQQAGVSYGFILLDDLLRERAPEARVFIFPNLFRVDPALREQLHQYLAEHGAAAIWLYAPGAMAVADPAAGVSELTQINVGTYEDPVPATSSYTLTGNWVQEGTAFGESDLWAPAFFIDDDGADAIAQYSATDDASVAVKFMEDGWASVYIATPAVTAELIREILEVLDHQPIIRGGGSIRQQSFSIRNPYLLIHAREQGDRLLEFHEPYDIVDLLNAETGWPAKQTLQLRLRDGETRLFKLTPSPRGAEDRIDLGDAAAEETDESPTAEAPVENSASDELHDP